MKLPYLPPLRFPTWGKFNLSLLGKQRYSHNEGEVSCSFDETSVLPHYNHVEMAGFEASSIISYKVEKDLSLKLYRFCIFPRLRVNPNLTNSSLTYAFRGVRVGSGKEKTSNASFDGILRLYSKVDDVKVEREFIIASEYKSLIEKITLTAEDDTEVKLFNKKPTKKIAKCFSASGEAFLLHTELFDGNTPIGNKSLTVQIRKGESRYLTVVYGADKLTARQIIDSEKSRIKFISDSRDRLRIKTPDVQINAMTEFCKIRATESIFRTKNGLMHAPGGGGYYAALWTNDQCEYANPFFAYYGYDKANEQSVNCYKLYSALASEDKAIFTSIISEGTGFWHGAGDRGDSSMYIYGLTRYLMTVGNSSLAKEFLPSLVKASKFVIKKINANNVVESDSDELENRFESGTANLCTSCISYDAFVSLAYLYRELGEAEKAEEIEKYADKIKQGVETWFGATVEGYKTYRYCEEEKALRSWICLPLTIGILDRKEGTANALLSDKLRTGNGILTRSGEKTYWDRSTLYTIKGLFCAGAADKALELLHNYSVERLTGEHVPYPVEAFPEGNAAQLSAEGALYIRIFTEGILGFRPVGLGKFILTPSIPTSWSGISIKKMIVGGKSLEIEVTRVNEKSVIKINGTTVQANVLITASEIGSAIKK